MKPLLLTNIAINLNEFRKICWSKQSSLVNRKQVLFLQDNARPHIAKMTLAKIAELKWEIMLHPPYSPDLSPIDFHLFLGLDNHMKNRTFNNEDDLKTNVHNFFQSKTKDFYKNGIIQLGEGHRMWWFIFWWINTFKTLNMHL